MSDPKTQFDCDNVFLFGAGSSADARIPMMDDFMDTMVRLAASRHASLEKEDRTILEDGLEVRAYLDSYHGRAALNVWNIEDLMSVLAFDAMSDSAEGSERLSAMNKAIGKVIDLTCSLRAANAPAQLSILGAASVYTKFWRSLIKWCHNHGASMPVFITLNYDLVLERSLIKTLKAPSWGTRNDAKFDYDSVRIQYANRGGPFFQATATPPHAQVGLQPETNNVQLKEEHCGHHSNTLLIRLLKLHGSLNFPKSFQERFDEARMTETQLLSSQPDPAIVPPVSNKTGVGSVVNPWPAALEAIRACRNLIICGYSLPESDSYMRYFLKAAVGPNRNLQTVQIFNPSLFVDDDRARSLKQRFEATFAEGFRGRLRFLPSRVTHPEGVAVKDQMQVKQGSFNHLTEKIYWEPNSVLFS